MINSRHFINYQKKMVLSQVLATEMYKISNGLSTHLMKNIFSVNRNAYIIVQNSQFSGLRISTMYHVTESISNPGPKIQDLGPSDLKETCDLDKFKKPKKQQKHEDCICRLYKVFVQNRSFLEKLLERSNHLSY